MEFRDHRVVVTTTMGSNCFEDDRVLTSDRRLDALIGDDPRALWLAKHAGHAVEEIPRTAVSDSNAVTLKCVDCSIAFAT